jgi:hypothetical protein
MSVYNISNQTTSLKATGFFVLAQTIYGVILEPYKVQSRPLSSCPGPGSLPQQNGMDDNILGSGIGGAKVLKIDMSGMISCLVVFYTYLTDAPKFHHSKPVS